MIASKTLKICRLSWMTKRTMIMVNICRTTNINPTLVNYYIRSQQQQQQQRSYIQYDDPNKNLDESSSAVQQQQKPYVWQEPPGRMKKILDTIRITQKRYTYIENRSLVKIKDVVRRIRISNSAMVTRIGLIKDMYEDCSLSLQQIKTKVQLLCEQHNLLEQVQQIKPRRKFRFQLDPMKKDIYDDKYNHDNKNDDDDDDDNDNNKMNTKNSSNSNNDDDDTGHTTQNQKH
jgi:hypothetical protein